MKEIMLSELVIVFLLLLPVIQPFIKGFRTQEGLVWLPLIALLVCIGFVPAYGFRPECVPLFVYALVVNIRKFHTLILNVKRAYIAPYDENLVPILLSLLFLSLGMGMALYFAPSVDTALLNQGVRSVRLIDSTRNATIVARVYETPSVNVARTADAHPTILMVPPELGSAPSVDRLCGQLRDNGFTVISYSRLGFDAPAVSEDGKLRYPALGNLLGLFNTAISGTDTEKANQRGKLMEEGRQRDIEFLLSSIRDGGLGLAASGSMILAAYDAGASALIMLAASPAFVAAHPEVKGVIAVESPLWSVYQTEIKAVLENPSWWTRLLDNLANLWPKPVRATGELPRPMIPTLFLVSDKVTKQKERNGRYSPVVRSLRLPSSMALLIAVEGAGTLDYADYPAKYPLYSLFFSGRSQSAWRDKDFIAGTASLMGNFATLVLEQPVAGIHHWETGLSDKSYFEAGGGWNLPNARSILLP
ncbi:MAG: hypothetical protein LBF87_03490 [Treponema sp.]|jgi:hypothetical protein|nr:hypothetical protein [Treponema sp.]